MLLDHRKWNHALQTWYMASVWCSSLCLTLTYRTLIENFKLKSNPLINIRTYIQIDIAILALLQNLSLGDCTIDIPPLYCHQQGGTYLFVVRYLICVTARHSEGPPSWRSAIPKVCYSNSLYWHSVYKLLSINVATSGDWSDSGSVRVSRVR